jgi:uncharacterized repeat protein (TIGR04138 family)
MQDRSNFYQLVEELIKQDTRYKGDAYEFIMQALHFTQNKLKRDTHVTGRELTEGIRDYAIQQYGPMAKTVFTHWGITSTLDFGNIVFNMIEKKILSKTESDSLDDFKDIYDFDNAFGNVLRNFNVKDLK